jgi:polyphenol oxidase
MREVAPPDWLIADWPRVLSNVGIRAMVTTRAGGAGGQGGLATFNLRLSRHEPAEVTAAHRMRLAACLPAEPVWLNQTHSTRVLDVDSVPDPNAHARAESADASVTARANQVLAVLTADCLPVLFACPTTGVIGAAHAGWRGLANGILEATVAQMVRRGAAPGSIHAYLGPAISARAFEVGEDVWDTFCKPDAANAQAFTAIPDRAGKYLADLYELARLRLRGAGLADEHLSGGHACTFSEPDRYYSYRRDGEVSGRMASLIWTEDRGPAEL